MLGFMVLSDKSSFFRGLRVTPGNPALCRLDPGRCQPLKKSSQGQTLAGVRLKIFGRGLTLTKGGSQITAREDPAGPGSIFFCRSNPGWSLRQMLSREQAPDVAGVTKIYC